MERDPSYEHIQQVVRSFIVSLSPPEGLYNRLTKGEEPYVLRFYVGKKTSEDGKSRYTLIGGKIKDNENFPEAIQREINEEGDFALLGIPWSTVIGRWRYSSVKSGPRDVILTYTPVLPNGEVKIGNGVNDIVFLNIDQLTQLVREGVLNGIPLEGHLAITDQPLDKIEILEEDKEKRNLAMERGINWVRHIEEYLRKKFKNLIIQDNRLISEEEFYQEYQKILSKFIRRGLEVGVRRKEFQGDILEALNGGFLGKDILYYLPQLAKEGLDWSGLSEATEGVRTFVGFLRDVFTQFLSKNSITEEYYRENLSSEKISLEDKYQAIRLLDDFFRGRLKKVFNLTDADLDMALTYVSNFFRELSNEMKVADPNLTQGLYQDYVLSNEVNNANCGRLLSLFLGYDTKKNQKDKELIRFEAGRHLLLLLKTLGSMKSYESQIKRIREGKLKLALDNFFGSIFDGQTIELNNSVQMQVRVREREDGQIMIVDEKPTKTFSSFLRKSFEEKLSIIRDIYSISLVLWDQEEAGNFSSDTYNKKVTELVNYLKSQFPNEEVWHDELNLYGSEDFINKGEITVEGKRTGSQSKRMVRAKTFIHMGDECVELTIYPFLKIDGSNYWGWLEKINDDKDYVVKRLLAGNNGIPSFYELLFPHSLYPAHYQHILKANYHQ